MSKTAWIATLLSIIILIFAGGLFLVKNKNKQNLLSPLVQNQNGEDLPQVTPDLTYTDEAGFSFKYPKIISVKDLTPDNQVYYSLLSLTDGKKELKITIKDIESETVPPTGAEVTGAVTLAGLSAKQYKTNSSQLTIATDQGILYQIESPLGNSLWENVHEIIVSTFTLNKSQDTKQPTSGSNTVYEEEEIVE